MRLPRLGEHAVPARKITHYLLDATSPEGAGKAKFLALFGFDPTRPGELEAALLQHPFSHEVERVETTRHGDKHHVRCSLRTPDGRSPCMLTVWIIRGEAPPQLVTAVPG